MVDIEMRKENQRGKIREKEVKEEKRRKRKE